MINTKHIFSEQNILVAVPTYNNAGTIAHVITDLRKYVDNILIVNDGSTDNTSDILAASSVEHISYTKNKGKGYAIRQAFKYALANDYKYVLTIDSDGQHFASDLSSFAQSISSYPDSLIIGARNLKADNMPSKNTFANKFSNFWYHIETGIRLDDTQSGYRLYPVKEMGNLLFLSNRYEFEVEVIVRSAWKGINVLNIPVHVYYPPAEERVSHFKPIKDFTRISILNSILVIIALIYYYPVKFIKSLSKENIKRFIQNNLTNLPDSNHKISASIGLGIFFGIAPLWGYQMLTAGITAHFLKLNKVITLISSNISIPPMIPLIIYGSFFMGGLLLDRDLNLNFSTAALSDIYKDIFQYILGAIILAISCGLLAYIISRIILLLFRRNING